MYGQVEGLKEFSTENLLTELKHRFRFDVKCIGKIQALEQEILISQLK